MEIHILLSGIKLGPYSKEQVRQYLAEGHLKPSDPARLDETKDWSTVEKVLGLSSPTPPPPPPPPPVVPPPAPPAASPPATHPPLEVAPAPPPAKPVKVTPRILDDALKPPVVASAASTSIPKPVVVQATPSTLPKSKTAAAKSKLLLKPAIQKQASQPLKTPKPSPKGLSKQRLFAGLGVLGGLVLLFLFYALSPHDKSDSSQNKSAEAGQDQPPQPLILQSPEKQTKIEPAQLVVPTTNNDPTPTPTQAPTPSPSPTAESPSSPEISPISPNNTNVAVSQPDPESVPKLNPVSASIYLEEGDRKTTSGDLDEAIADYTQALQLDPKLKMAASNRGLAKQAKGDLDGAIADYTQALQLDPTFIIAYRNRGLAMQGKGAWDDAIADYTHALGLDTKDTIDYYSRGLAKQAKGDAKGALADLREFCQLAPQDIYTRYAHLYIWVISAQQRHTKDIDQELSAALGSGLDSTTDDLAPKIGEFLLHETYEYDLISAAASPDAKKSQERYCEVWYFAGMYRLLKGDKATAIDYFHKCVVTGQTNYCEYLLAQAELKMLDKAY